MDIYRVENSQIVIEKDNINRRYLYNPETKCLLLPSDHYIDFSADELETIKNTPEIDHIFNHENIDTIRDEF